MTMQDVDMAKEEQTDRLTHLWQGMERVIREMETSTLLPQNVTEDTRQKMQSPFQDLAHLAGQVRESSAGTPAPPRETGASAGANSNHPQVTLHDHLKKNAIQAQTGATGVDPMDTGS